ncbi:hypothetical protein PIB30_094626 [Stylosanthes scabra]|uniref:TCP domain-containing protein n=1 Tax=Stylosanthes scabra TaxID=79078 RepID=A0ABU6XW70_9FABA|nr:hypothetical protein [Stylosanthes scabra]
MNNNSSPKDPSDFPLKQETDHHHQQQHEKPSSSAAAKASTTSSSSSQWLRLKDPRIVRVSRAFGGKDRHSKVCTIRGLRDRRVRLSVPTAIQLYDLQDRLGLNQPSKVVDWLLNAAKHEIDELPPLPNITNPFTLAGSSSSSSIINNTNEAGTSMFNINRSIHQWQGLAQSYSKWNNNKSKSSSSFTKQEDNQMVTEEDDNNNKEEDEEGAANVVSNNTNHHHHPSFLGLLNTMPIAAGNYQFEAHNNDVNVAQLGNHHHHHGFITNQTDLQSINVVPFPSTLSLSTQSYFPSHSSSEAMEDNSSMHQMLTSHHHLHQNLFTNNNNLPSFSLAMMSTPILLHHPPNTRESSTQSHHHHHKDHHFPSSK